jgi:hypothetical protein
VDTAECPDGTPRTYTPTSSRCPYANLGAFSRVPSPFSGGLLVPSSSSVKPTAEVSKHRQWFSHSLTDWLTADRLNSFRGVPDSRYYVLPFLSFFSP